ncbi:hypothetical protein BGW36DRAFT_110710 [Talaromyces proteolyticus]|uniref:Uncharacterized protein n=1 Tax=Talaromyces proteolyticus TaxID=1131652 RepID=A0AAD4KYD6_9EURO|nr:uncharacterized protein BGW36DRAFT_110710 [Talaromyces proteolyticus]KAH8702078.1 hypothetical protein BGW36DRAFT_110710 [Talaromyces proteolyticus]
MELKQDSVIAVNICLSIMSKIAAIMTTVKCGLIFQPVLRRFATFRFACLGTGALVKVLRRFAFAKVAYLATDVLSQEKC